MGFQNVNMRPYVARFRHCTNHGVSGALCALLALLAARGSPVGTVGGPMTLFFVHPLPS